ncbi:MAG: ATP-binding cassette domain-containing protein [Alphaproteobacteria bacterium]|nr:ATP-binding cassette domain-containing protein [Alphaproteobacteria bacterium]MBV9371202.1 ATP-binding cassette domain-containing protein [Alphaproteobacteria bacterium]MBV9899932.1 ATP-binding cassette domain-containing protein [Alphaproteobacteria bacterium]
MTLALETVGLTKRFGRGGPGAAAAVDGVSLRVPARAVYGFLGANGAGKTTTLRLVLGLLRPSAGEVRLFGRPARDRRAERVGALIEAPSLYPHLTGRENLALTRRLLGLPAAEIDRVLEIVGLSDAAGRTAGAYSLGMRQRLAIARALLGRPRLLILDEPTNGLDPDGIREMRALLRRLPEAGDTTLIVSSHLLAEVERIATHVGLLHRGRLLVEAPLERLLGGGGAVEVGIADRGRGARILREAGFRVSATDEDGRLLVEAPDAPPPDPAAIAALLVARGAAPSHLARRRPSLESVYHAAVARPA